MEKYKNLSGTSKVFAYEVLPYSLWVRFKDGSNYLYTVSSVGPIKLKMMQFLAESGLGLGVFIHQFAENAYAVKSEE